ncbi:MAG TPA: response regulator transcription factor [Acidobacteriaceae bacterium]|nr:response regulator transcription factor [Acidobacteriaceae bacterium]
MRSTSARILVYDNSVLQCELLAKGLESLQLGLEIVCATDPGSLHTLLTEDANSVVIVSDASMNGSTLSFAKQLRVRYAGLPIIFLLQEGRHDRVIEAFRIGARGIVYSTENLSQLAKCIDCVLQGEVWVRRADLSMIFEGLLKPTVRVTDVNGKTLLTPREEEISLLVAEGMTNREISRTLSISESTVKNSLFHIFEKLGISNRVELAQYMNGPSASDETAFRYRDADPAA